MQPFWTRIHNYGELFIERKGAKNSNGVLNSEANGKCSRFLDVLLQMSFAVRLVNADFYSENPINGFDDIYSEFRGAQISKVPVIRIFGSTPAGQKTCLHVHGVFPYVYIPYDGTQPKERYLFLLACSLDKAINISMGSADAGTRHVHNIELVNRIPFYGYHRKEHQFLKIYFYNPYIVKKAVELLQNGAVMSRNFQLYFAHIPYLLQMFIDYNLYGMNMVQLSKVKFRRKITLGAYPPYQYPSLSPSSDCGNLNVIWDPYNIPEHMLFDDTVVLKSTCYLEADCVAPDILNRCDMSGMKMNPGIAFIWEDERQRRRQNGLDSQMSVPPSQERNYALPTDSEEHFLQQLKKKLTELQSESLDVSCLTSQSHESSGIEAEETGSQPSVQNMELSQDLEETVVDEEVALSLSLPGSASGSQNTANLSLDNNDLELAEILQNLASSQSSSGSSIWLTQQSQNAKNNETDEEHDSDDETLKWMQEDWLSQVDAGCEDETILVTDNNEKSGMQDSWDWRNNEEVIPQLDGPGDVLPQPKRKINLSLPKRTNNQVLAENSEPLRCKKIVTKHGVSPRNLNNDIEPIVEVAANNQVSSTTVPKKLVTICKIGSLQVKIPHGVRARDLEAIGKEVLCIDKLSEKGATLVQKDKRCVKRNRCKVETENPSIAATRSKRANVNYGPNQFTHLYKGPRIPGTQAFCLDDVSTCKLFGCLYHSPSKAKVLLKRVDKEFPEVKLISEDLTRRLSEPITNDDGKVCKLSEESEEKTKVINSQSLEDSVIVEDEDCKIIPFEDSVVEDCEVIQGTESFVPIDNINVKELVKSSRVPDKLEVPDYWATKTVAEEFNDTLCKMSFIFPKCDSKLDTLNRPSTVTSASFEDTGITSKSSSENCEHQMVINESRSSSPILQHCTPTRMQMSQGFESFYEYSAVKPFSQTVIDKTDVAIVGKTKIFQYGPLPPSSTHIEKTMAEYGIPNARYMDAFFSCAKDVPVKALEVGGRVLKLKSNLTADLPEFEGRFQNAGIENWKMILSIDAMDSERAAASTPKYSLFEPVRPPPSRKEVERWLMETQKQIQKQVPVACKEKSDRSPKLQRVKLPAIEISPIRTTSQNQNQLLGPSPVLDATFAALCSTPVNPTKGTNLSPLDASKLKRSFSDGEDTVNTDTKTKKSSLRLKTTKQRRLSFDDNLRRKALVIQANKGSRGNSQIDGVTLNNTYGFKVSPRDIAGARATVECQGLTLMSMELHMRTRESMCPDPRFDEICAVFYHVKYDVPDSVTGSSKKTTGIIIWDERKNHFKRNVLKRAGFAGANVATVYSEIELIKEFTKLVIEFDPDIILGYEIQLTSWGYLLERAEILGITLAPKISRIPDEVKGSHLISDDDELVSQTCEIYIRGRIVLNVWRIMRSEVTLTSYSFENVVFHVLHHRTAKYPYQKLTHWFDHDTDLYRWKTIKYYALRAEGNILLLEKLDVVTRTSELAKLFGILFYDVLSRGSQFRVESMMHRLTTAANYITVSPSILQRATMRAPECVQLILEPESRFYTHPVVVLDFQSLYPSIVIAYNYCYSTCLGRVEHHGKSEPFDFGCTTLKVPPALLKSLQGKIHYSPTGIAFVTSEVRRGILPQMLDEILSTRIMVKNALKAVKGDRGLEKLLDARQLGLKLIANVTYGYTSANFSGRMPCVEVGDSILGKARETLERAIRLVESTRKWDAKVVYGDTDSMFVHLPGRSREDAFRIGREMADAVTACNPWPVRLKFEKVYLPCVLQTKKRYVGFKYESESQTLPVFDAKGIETVRRDGCPAVVKVLEKSLHILFKTSDVSQVKAYVQKQFTKLLSGRASAQDYVFAREYRGMKTYKMGAHVAALEIAKRRLREDPRSEPRIGERVPYVIVYGSPGLPLIKLVREPQDLLKDPSLRLNAHYYVSNVICAPLQRNFSLIGADVNAWYAELPRVLRAPYMAAVTLAPGASISRYFTVDNCSVCNEPSGSGGNVCGVCRTKPQTVAIIVAERARKAERKYAHHQMICKSCTGEVSATELACSSLDCPVLFRFHQSKWDCAEVTRLRSLQW